MEVLSIENHLRKLFPGISTLEIKQLESAGESFIAHKNDVVYAQNDGCRGLLFLVNGKAYIHLKDGSNNVENIVHFLTPGEVFYMQEAFLGIKNQTSCVCLDTSLFFILPGFLLKELSLKHPNLMMKMLAISSAETKIFEQRAGNLITLPVKYRFIDSLKTLLSKFGEQKVDHFFIPVKREEIGSYINASKASLSRIVTELEDHKIIKTNRQGIKILNQDYFTKAHTLV